MTQQIIWVAFSFSINFDGGDLLFTLNGGGFNTNVVVPNVPGGSGSVETMFTSSAEGEVSGEVTADNTSGSGGFYTRSNR